MVTTRSADGDTITGFVKVKPVFGRLPKAWNGESGVKQISTIEARAAAMDLRRQGNSYRQIGLLMGIAPNAAWNLVQTELLAIREAMSEDTEAVRDLELQRCDEWNKALGPGVRIGDPAAISAAIRVSERRAKLLGLDAPVKAEIFGALITPDEASKLSESDILDRLKRMLALASAINPALPIIEAEPPDEDQSDAAIEEYETRPPVHTVIDVTPRLRARYAVSPIDFVEDDVEG